MYNFKELRLNNFMSYESMYIDFSQRGLWTINGFNQKGGDSNGAGKSALLSGLVWTLFGRTPNGITGKDVVRWGKDNCSGILKLSSNSHTYEIVRSLDSIEFLIDGEKQKGHKKDIQDLINNTFGTDYQLFLTFNIFTKAWSNFITEIGDSGRKKLFKSILMLDQLDKAYDNAKNIYNNLTVQANQAEATIKQLTSTLPELEELLNKNKELAENEEKTKQDAIIEFEKQKEILKSNIQDTNLADAINEIDHEIEQFSKQKIDEKLEYANIQLTGINNLVYHDQMLIKEKEEALKIAGTMGGDCPMCGQKILQKNKKMHIRHLEIMIDEYKESLKNNLHEKLNIEKEIYNFEEINRNIIECGHKRAELEMKIWEQDNNIQKYNDFCKMAEVSIKNLVNNRIDYDKLTKMTQDKINKTQLELDKQSILFNNYLKEIDYFNYLQWLYSRQGIINLIINKCFARLTFLSNRILRRFSSEFKIQISGQKQLKSGDYKDEVDIFVYSGGQKINYDSLSGGQQQRVNIAMLLALYTFGREMGVNQFDCIMLDEILDLSLADKGQEDVLEILYSMKSQISHIILVSHKDNLKGRFDREINVIRDEKGISRMA